MSDKFCPIPWKFIAVRNNGDMRVCCQANTSESKGIFRKENGKSYNVNYDHIHEARNSKLAKDIRRTMLNNEDHEACIRCDREDRNGIRSRRQYEREDRKDTFTIDDAKSLTNPDGSINTENNPLEALDLRFGNKCNLKCRMCGPTDSDAWYNDYVKLWDYTIYEDSGTKVQLEKNKKGNWYPKNDIYNWIESDAFWDDIENNMSHLTYLHTVGGEPLLIERQFELLKKCIDADIAKNISLEYNTNGTLIPERAWDLWKHFKCVKIGLSIDGIEEVNDYIRYPSKWNIVHENIKRLDKAKGEFHLWFAFTVQAYNILHIPEVLKWVIESNFERFGTGEKQPFLTVHPLHGPPHYNIKLFPKPVKDQISIKLREFYTWLNDYTEANKLPLRKRSIYLNGAQKIIEGFINYMDDADYSNHFDIFWNNTKKLDSIRNQSFEKSLPELYEIIKPYTKS